MDVRGKGGRLVRTASQGEEWEAAWRVSGKGLSAWCRENDVAWYSLRQWIQKREKQRPRQLPQLVELRMASPEVPSSYEIGLPKGRTLTVGPSFDDSTVARLVHLLERT